MFVFFPKNFAKSTDPNLGGPDRVKLFPRKNGQKTG
jgi:hypothetical protein